MHIKTLVKNFLHIDIRIILLHLISQKGDYDLQEIRIRLNKPLEIKIKSKNYFLTENGTITNDVKEAFFITDEIFSHTLNKISKHSMYAFQDELKNGFITLNGSHRVGIVGTCVMEDGQIKSVKDIQSLNIRLSHEIYGVCDNIKKIYRNGITNTLIISPPSCGKTTMLRDLLRVFSDEHLKTVGVVDERYEIGGNAIGFRTDVITNCPKSIGMITLLRTMSPYVICVDEIGKKEDVISLLELFNCGIKVVATIHAKDINEIRNKENIKKVIEQKYFDNYIVLNGDYDSVPKVYNKNFQEVLL